jgi:RHS repeat-associated protein
MFSSAGNYDRFDRFGRPLKFIWKNRTSGAVLDQVEYTYDYAGNRLARNVRVDQINGSYADERDQDYDYDGLHRLLDADQGGASDTTGLVSDPLFEQRWTLDQLGNWPEFRQDTNGDTDFTDSDDFDQDRLHNSANEIDNDNNHANTPSGTITAASLQVDWADPVQDAAGNMTTVQIPPGSAAGGMQLKYDAWNRMTTVSVLGIGTIVSYEYDGLGQRIRKDLPGGSSFDRDYYFNDQWQLLTEVTGGNVEAIYHWHPFYIDALAVRMRASDTHFFIQDANFSVTAAVDDNGNTVVERYSYTPYGEVIFLDADFALDADNASDIDNQHLYTGRERDDACNLQLNRYRWYASNLGRWLARDPIEYEGGDLNLYAYVGAQCITAVDPLALRAPPQVIQRCNLQCNGFADYFTCMELCMYPEVRGGSIATIVGEYSSAPGGERFRELPPTVTGPVFPEVDDVDDMILKLKCGNKCLDTLIVCAHGGTQGYCDLSPGFGREKPFPGSCSLGQIDDIQKIVCPTGTVILATCAEKWPEEKAGPELQDKANKLKRKTCQCPPGSTHGRAALMCKNKKTGRYVRMICRSPE